jgi:hypothetical protein
MMVALLATPRKEDGKLAARVWAICANAKEAFAEL